LIREPEKAARRPAIWGILSFDLVFPANLLRKHEPRVLDRGETGIGGERLKIAELRDGMRRVDLVAEVVEISEPREVRSRYSDETFRVAEATVSDGSGTIKLVLWNEQIDQVNVNDKVQVQNGYTKSFRGEVQLNVGRYGKLTVL